MVNLHRLAQKEAEFETMPTIYGPTVNDRGQPMQPTYRMKAWDKLDENNPLYKLDEAQHLLDGGMIRYDGDTAKLENIEWVQAEMKRVCQVLFTPEFMLE